MWRGLAACDSAAEGLAQLVTGDALEIGVGLTAFRLLVPFKPLLNGDADCLFDIHLSSAIPSGHTGQWLEKSHGARALRRSRQSGAESAGISAKGRIANLLGAKN